MDVDVDFRFSGFFQRINGYGTARGLCKAAR